MSVYIAVYVVTPTLIDDLGLTSGIHSVLPMTVSLPPFPTQAMLEIHLEKDCEGDSGSIISEDLCAARSSSSSVDCRLSTLRSIGRPHYHRTGMDHTKRARTWRNVAAFSKCYRAVTRVVFGRSWRLMYDFLVGVCFGFRCFLCWTEDGYFY